MCDYEKIKTHNFFFVLFCFFALHCTLRSVLSTFCRLSHKLSCGSRVHSEENVCSPQNRRHPSLRSAATPTQPLRGEPFPKQLVSRLCRGFWKSLVTITLRFVELCNRFRFLMEEGTPLLDKRTSKSRQESGCYFPCRCTLATLSSAGFCVVYLLRVNLSVALVAMVNSTYANAKASAHDPECQRNTWKQSIRA